MQAVCEDLALSQEDDPPAPADQVRNLSDGYNLTTTHEIPMRFKSVVGYKAKNTYLDSFQTRSGSSPKLLALVRTISMNERPTSKYQPHYVFRHETSLPWPYRKIYSCSRQKGGRTSSKSPRHWVANP